MDFEGADRSDFYDQLAARENKGSAGKGVKGVFDPLAGLARPP